MAGIQLRFGTDEYKNAKAELQGYQTQLGSLTQKLDPCATNQFIQQQEYEEAADYDNLYAAASENLSAAEGELRQLDEDAAKIEQSIKRKNGKITSFTKSDGTKIKNDEDASSEYNHQIELIAQKRSSINTKIEEARQEQLRITQERHSKQLKETQIEQQEAADAKKELDDLNAEINALNNKIAPLDEAIKKADEDKVDVAAQNNEDWTFYAKKELEAEGVKNPSKKQIQARAEEIKQRNIELGNCNKKGELIVGKTIVTLTGRSKGVADDMASAEEAVSQYNSAIGKKASKAIESALGKLTAEEKAAYDKLKPDQKSKIQARVLNSINHGGDGNALAIIQGTIGPVATASNTSQDVQKILNSLSPDEKQKLEALKKSNPSKYSEIMDLIKNSLHTCSDFNTAKDIVKDLLKNANIDVDKFVNSATKKVLNKASFAIKPGSKYFQQAFKSIKNWVNLDGKPAQYLGKAGKFLKFAPVMNITVTAADIAVAIDNPTPENIADAVFSGLGTAVSFVPVIGTALSLSVSAVYERAKDSDGCIDYVRTQYSYVNLDGGLDGEDLHNYINDGQ